MYSKFSSFQVFGDEPQLGGTSLGPKMGTSVGWGDWQNFHRMGGPPVPPKKKKPWEELSTKGPTTGTCCKHGKQNQPLGIWVTPYKMQNFVYEWVDFSKKHQIWDKIGLNLRKFWKNWVILLKIWPEIGLIGSWMGSSSWKISICMGLLSNSAVACPYQYQTKVEYPSPPIPNKFTWSSNGNHSIETNVA